MNIKKFLLLSVIAIVAAMSANGAELSREALNLRSQIKSYLSQEGYVPTIDEDGDIKFKYQGYTYYISVSDIASNLTVMYQIGVNVPASATSTKVTDVCTEITQSKLCARAVPTSSGKTIRIRIDTFCSGIQMFKELFYQNMKLLDTVSDDALKLFNN